MNRKMCLRNATLKRLDIVQIKSRLTIYLNMGHLQRVTMGTITSILANILNQTESKLLISHDQSEIRSLTHFFTAFPLFSPSLFLFSLFTPCLSFFLLPLSNILLMLPVFLGLGDRTITLLHIIFFSLLYFGGIYLLA